MPSADVETQLAAFRRGAVDLLEERELVGRLETGRPQRVKFGMDPSSPDLHLGHAIPLLKLRDLQDLGHTVVIVVGDATAMVGDPSGRNKLRPQLTRADVERNLETYVEQVGLVLDMDRTEVRRNSEWFDRLDFGGLLTLCGRMTVARMLERDTFQRRMQAAEPIGIHEFLYPLLQGWDSVELSADVEFGGTDQLFNLLVGRQFQEQEGQPPQVCLTTPLIDGSDGRKMSKSYGNAIGLTEPPNEQFGKVMALPDDVLGTWFTLLTRLDEARIAALLAGHPREAKATLAATIVDRFHGAGAGAAARGAFDRVVRDKKLPDDIPEQNFKRPPGDGTIPLAVLLRELGLAASSSEARRMIEGRGVRLDGQVQVDPSGLVQLPTSSTQELLIQYGRRKFSLVRIVD